MTTNKYGEARMMARTNWESPMLHLQGIGREDGRPYGMSVDIRVQPDVIAWLNTQEPTMPSANLMVDNATGEPSILHKPNQYIEARLQADGERIAILLVGESVNHPEGALVELSTTAASVEYAVNFAEANGILSSDVDTHTGGESNDDSSLSAGEEE